MLTTTPNRTAVTANPDDDALKAKHAAMWASGNYPAVADEIVGSLGTTLVEAVDVRPGQRVLDVAAGTGTSAVPAARRGAIDRKSTRLNSSHANISYAVFCLKKKKTTITTLHI